MLILVDLDGVVYRGSRAVPGVAAVLADRVRAGDEVVYVTNNSMYYRATYVERLLAFGAPASLDRVVSSARATALYLDARDPRPGRVLVLGGHGLRRELEDLGFDVVMAGDAAERRRDGDLSAPEAAGHPDVVVVGLDREVTYARLSVASEVIRAGAFFVATNRDPVYPMERTLQPGSGAIVGAVEIASGVTPVSIGKPEPYLLEQAARAVGRRASDAVMVGDGVLTDLPAAHAIGARFVLMLTGVTSAEQAGALPLDRRPDAVAANADELAAALNRLAADTRHPPPADGSTRTE